MKTVLTIILFYTNTSFICQFNQSQIQSKKIEKLLCKDWSYEYSIINGKKEVISNETFTNGPTTVFFRIDFRKMGKKELQRFYTNRPKEYQNLLKGTELEGIEMFGDYKGCPEYPILLNDSVDINGDLVDCSIQTYGNCDGNGNPQKWKSFKIDKLTKDTLVISGYMGQPLENKIAYSRIK